MADKIDQLTIGSSSYDIDLPVDNDTRINTCYTLTGLSTVAGSATSGAYKSVRWYTSNIGNDITAPYDGMKIMAKVPLAGVGTAGVILSINGNNDDDYHPVAYNVNTVLTTHYPVNTYKIFVYDANQTMTCYKSSGTAVTVTGVWKGESNYDSNTTITYGTLAYYFRPYVGTQALYRYKFVMLDKDNRLVPLTTTNVSSGESVVTNQTPTNVAFRPDKIYWYNTTATVNAGAVIGGNTLVAIGYNANNSTNGGMARCNFNASVPAYRMIYLCGTYNKTTGLFTLRGAGTASSTQYYVFVPTNTANLNLDSYFDTGYDYILLGGTYSSADYIHLMDNNPLYHFDGTNLLPYDTWDISQSSGSSDNQKVKAGNVTFGNNDTVDIVAGTNISVTGASSGTGAPKITISTPITVSSSAGVSDGTNTYKYTLPSNVVQDSNYAHITVTSSSVSDGTTTFNKLGLAGTGSATTAAKSDHTHDYSNTYQAKFGAQNANKVYAGPSNGSDATPSFRSLVKADLPTLTASDVGALASSTKYAGSSTAGGAASSAEKLTNTSKIGDTNKPVYFTSNGVPAEISYTIGKSVPSDAVFTDTQSDWSVTDSSSNAYIKNKPTIPATNVIPAETTANKILLSTTTSGTAAWSSGALSSSSTKPLYLSSSGVLSAADTYAGGTAITLNNTSKAASTASFYAPTSGGASKKLLVGNGTTSAPVWSAESTWNGIAGFLKVSEFGVTSVDNSTYATSNEVVHKGTSSSLSNEDIYGTKTFKNSTGITFVPTGLATSGVNISPGNDTTGATIDISSNWGAPTFLQIGGNSTSGYGTLKIHNNSPISQAHPSSDSAVFQWSYGSGTSAKSAYLLLPNVGTSAYPKTLATTDDIPTVTWRPIAIAGNNILGATSSATLNFVNTGNVTFSGNATTGLSANAALPQIDDWRSEA